MDTQTCEVMPQSQRGVMAAFDMICDRLARLEAIADHRISRLEAIADHRISRLEAIADHRISRLEAIADHWLRREKEKDFDKGGEMDSRLMGWDRDVILVWKNPGLAYPHGVHMTWDAMRISAPSHRVPDYETPDDIFGQDRPKTQAALARLGLSGQHLTIDNDPVLCSDVGLHSDFNLLHHAVSEEVMLEALRQERASGLTCHGVMLDPLGVWLEHTDYQNLEYWVSLGSRLFQTCALTEGPLELQPFELQDLRVIVPYERSTLAPPHRQIPLLVQSKQACEPLIGEYGLKTYKSNSFSFNRMLRDFRDHSL